MTQTQKQNVPKLRFPEFEGDWQKRKLGELGPVSMCKRVMKDETKPSGDVPFYKIGTFGREPDAFIDRELFDRYLERYPFPKTGDVLISAAGTIGRLVVYDGSPAYFQDSNIVWVANDERDVSNKFLLSCYQNTRWTTEDTTIARLYNDNLRNIDISAPTLPEQRKIARFLSAVDTKIAQLSEKKRLLEDYKKGCMQQLFSKNIRFKDEDGNDFPEWEEKKLGEVATFSKGKGISKADIAEDGENSCIRYGELYTEYNEHIERVVSKTDTPLKGAVISRKNDVLMPTSDVTPSGLATASALDIEGVILGGDILVIRSGQILNRYFAYFVAAHKPKIMRLVTGVTVYHIYGRDFATLQINIPHPAEQQKIAEFLSALDRKIILVTEELQQAETFKKGLFQQMFV
jgi:type I restriction enzyme S subunit